METPKIGRRLFAEGSLVTPQVMKVRIFADKLSAERREVYLTVAEKARETGLNPHESGEAALSDLEIREEADRQSIGARPVFMFAADATPGGVDQKLAAARRAVRQWRNGKAAQQAAKNQSQEQGSRPDAGRKIREAQQAAISRMLA